MSDTAALSPQRAIDHMARLLQMNPIHEGGEIICARNELLALAANKNGAMKTDTKRAVPAEDQRADRRKLLDQLESVRGQFWTVPIEELNNQLDALHSGGFVDLEAAVARLRIVAENRPRFPALAGKPGFDNIFFASFKEVLARSARDTVVLREQILGTLRVRSRRNAVRRMVQLLKTEMPGIYELESDWLDTLQRQKSPPATIRLTSNADRAQSGSEVSRGSWWVILVAVSIIVCLALVLDNGKGPTSRSPSNSNYQYVPPPKYVPNENREFGIQPPQQPRRGPSFDEKVWEPMLPPSSSKPREESNSQFGFGSVTPFALPTAENADEDWRKANDRYSR